MKNFWQNMTDKNPENKKDKKVYIESSGFTDWLYCKYRYGFEQEESRVKGKPGQKKKKKTTPTKHKWLQK